MYKNSLYILLFSLSVQFFHITVGSFHVNLYIPIMIILFFLYMKKIKITLPLNSYEFLLIVLYLYLFFSFYWADNKSLAFQLGILEIILIITYFLVRYIVDYISILEFENIIINIGKIYILVSIFFQMYSYLHNGFIYKGDSSRFAGLDESPNGYAFHGFVFFIFFLYKKKYLFSIITFITLILTLSTTIYIVLFLSYFIYLVYEKKIIKSILFQGGIVSIFIIIYYIYLSKFEIITTIINNRISRSSTGSGRFALWEYIINDKIPNNPIFGYGINQTRDIIHDFRELMSSHNVFIEVTLTSGVIGLYIYILFQLFLFMKILNITKIYNNYIFMMLFINYFIFSLANNTLYNVNNIIFFIIIYKYSNIQIYNNTYSTFAHKTQLL